MKIRIKGNSVRLRLTQSEVTQFEAVGKVSENIHFGLGKHLTYELVKSNSEIIEAKFEDSSIQILIPTHLGNQWATSDQVGIEYFKDLEDEKQLRILVEKDFKCLTIRQHEDESDAFPHPNEHELVC